MDIALSHVRDFTGCFINDISIFSKSFKEHLDHLWQTFEILRTNNLKLKFKKCEFAKAQITFLGHKVSAAGISPDAYNVNKIQQLMASKNFKGVRTLLGLTNYYKKFIKDYSKLVESLIWLTQHNVPFK